MSHNETDEPPIVSLENVASVLVEEFSKDELQGYASMNNPLVKVEGSKRELSDFSNSSLGTSDLHTKAHTHSSKDEVSSIIN